MQRKREGFGNEASCENRRIVRPAFSGAQMSSVVLVIAQPLLSRASIIHPESKVKEKVTVALRGLCLSIRAHRLTS